MINKEKDMKAVIINNNIPNKNGNTFSNEALSSIIQSIKNEDIYGQLGSVNDGSGIDAEQITHKIERPSLKDSVLECEINFLETPHAVNVSKIAKHISKHNFDLIKFKPNGIGKVDPLTSKIYNYKLNSISMIIE